MEKTIACPACDGAGWKENHTCDRCHGTGNVKRPMTNGDRIRSMTDKELAQFLVYFSTDRCDQCVYSGRCNNKCIAGVKDWLRQIVED